MIFIITGDCLTSGYRPGSGADNPRMGRGDVPHPFPSAAPERRPFLTRAPTVRTSPVGSGRDAEISAARDK